MIKLLKLLSLLALSAVFCSLAACGSQPTTPVWKYQTILIAPDASLLPVCPVTPPPVPTDYLAAIPSDREDMMTDAYTGQTKNISGCNKEIVRVNDWVVKQKALYPDATVSNGIDAPASAPVAASAPK